MPTPIRIPLSVNSINLANASAKWVAKAGTNFAYSYMQFANLSTGIVTYRGIIPANVAAIPTFTIVLYHHADSGGGGTALLTVKALSFSSGSAKDAVLTTLLNAVATTVNTSANLTISVVPGTDLITVTASQYLVVQVTRGTGAGDTIGAAWNLAEVVMQINII